MKQLIIIEPGAISESDKEKLEKEDYIVIEVADFTKVKTMIDIADVKPSEQYEDLFADLSLGGYYSTIMERFGQNIFKRIRNKK